MGLCSKKVCKIVSGVISLVFIVLGISIKWAIFPSVVDSMVKSNLELKETNTETWEAWIEPPIPVFMKFTFFNITNQDNFRDGLEKANVEEVGPFAYRETRIKEDINSVEDTISFGSYISYDYDEEESCPTCKFDSQVTVINPVMVIVSNLLKELEQSLPEIIHFPEITIPIADGAINLTWPATDYPREEIFQLIFGGLEKKVNCEDDTPEEECDDLFLTDTPDNMIYSGAHSGILKALYSVLKATITQIMNLIVAGSGDELAETVLQQVLDLVALPPMINFEEGTFGFFMGTNATKTWWKINNGMHDLAFYNMVEEFNGMSSLPESWWDSFGPTPSAHKAGLPGVCHDIVGTDGLGYGPPIKKDEDIWLFNDQLCRSIWLTFAGEENVQGVKTYSFKPTEDVFSMTNPNNMCYCPNVEQCAKEMEGEDAWDISECMDFEGDFKCFDGIINLRGCQGAPVYMSTPHFLAGDPRLSEAIDGINPDPVKHVTYLNLEPTTGLPIQAHKRIQVSVPLAPVEYFTAFKNVKNTIFPFVWVDEGADIDDENLNKLKSMLVTPFLVVDICVGLAIALGGVGILTIIAHSIFAK